MVKALSNNDDVNILSSLIIICHYISECYEDEFVSAVEDSGLIFSSSMFVIETTSMINDVGIIFHNYAFY